MNEQQQAAKKRRPGARKRSSPRAPGQVVECGWCRRSVPVPARGRVPKWCSPTCRHRAWEHAQAAASGRAAVEVIQRQIETIKTVTVVQHHRVEVPVSVRPNSVPAFVEILDDLTQRLDAGRVYDRDLPALTPAIADLVQALDRRVKGQWQPPWDR